MDIAKYKVPADKLRWECDPAIFEFNHTRNLAPLREFVGQDRAIRAIEFGLSMNRDGYNIYVAGLTGTGKTSVVKTYIQKLVERRKTEAKNRRLEDWCYIHNFTDPDRPQILNLPQGKGTLFRDQINKLLQQLKEELAKAFSSEEYTAQKKKTVEESRTRQQKLFEEMAEEAQQQGFQLQMTPVGPALVPLLEGKPLSQAEYIALEKPVREALDVKRTDLLKKLQATFEMVRELESQTVDKLQTADKEVADFTTSRLFK